MDSTNSAPSGARSVVLVHGAYADGSSWSSVIPYLLDAGLSVTAVQHSLDSLEQSVGATRRALASSPGPTVLVGHSFAGTIISEAGVDDVGRREAEVEPAAVGSQTRGHGVDEGRHVVVRLPLELGDAGGRRDARALAHRACARGRNGADLRPRIERGELHGEPVLELGLLRPE